MSADSKRAPKADPAPAVDDGAPSRLVVRDLEQAIGLQLRVIRDEGGLRQQDVADQMQRIGFDWTRSTVAALETGRRRLALAEVLGLLYALSRLLYQPIALGDLLGDAFDFVAVNPGWLLQVPHVQRVIDGSWTEKILEHRTLGEATSATKDLLVVADRLSRPVPEVRRRSIELWDGGFDAERQRRMRELLRVDNLVGADENASIWTAHERRTRVGHVTRQVRNDMELELREALGLPGPEDGVKADA